MTGLEAWHIVAPLIAAHSVARHERNVSPSLNLLDEAYIIIFGALKEHDERRKQEEKNETVQKHRRKTP